MAIPQGKFLDLVYLVLTTTWYTFNSQFYQQTDGVVMGGPAPSTTAENYMQAYEKYMQAYERTKLLRLCTLQKCGNNLVMTFILS